MSPYEAPALPYPSVSIREIPVSNGNTVYVAGPDFQQGPLPAVFYFSISGAESLTLDPFNQPVAFLQDAPLRVFSMDLPGHAPHQDKMKGLAAIAEEITAGQDPITRFCERVTQAIDELILLNWIDPHQIAAAGLSRGAFFAAHAASRDPRIHSVCGFAPLTSLGHLPDFATLRDHPLVRDSDVTRIASKLCNRQLRWYIGHSDEAVGTHTCNAAYEAIVAASRAARIRSAPLELMTHASIGHRGHGTAPHIFYSGALWLRYCLTRK